MSFLNMNEAEQQKEIGPIPSGTIVPMRVTLQKPKPEYSYTGPVPPELESIRPYLTGKLETQIVFLNLELTVLAGQFEKRKVFTRMMLWSANPTEGQNKAIDITKSKLRALVESARGVKPDDNSPDANQKRILNSLNDINGMGVVVKVGTEKAYRDENKTVNNVSVFVTPDKPEWKHVESLQIQQAPVTQEVSNPSQQNSGGASGW